MKLFPFQRAAVQRIIDAPKNRHILSFSTGLGKTATALKACEELEHEKILVVCPAVTRGGWLREMEQWTPGLASRAAVITEGRQRRGRSAKKQEAFDRAYQADVQIISYALLGEVEVSGWSCIVLDEIHYLKSPTSKQSQHVRFLVDSNPSAAVLGLSATLMPDKVSDLWNPLDTIWRREWGKPNRNKRYSYEFNSRYMHKRIKEFPGGSAIEWFGVRNEDELRTRLDNVASRVTKHEVGHLLPPYSVRKLDVYGAPLRAPATTLSREATQRLLERAADKKAKEVPSWAEEALDESSHILVFTYRKKLAHDLSAKLAKQLRLPTFTITGEQSPDARNDTISLWQGQARAVLCATMDSCGVGVNGLEVAGRMLFAELHYRPEKITQAMGRGNRLSSARGCNIDILVLAGTLDETVADVLLGKIAAINAAWTPDMSERDLEEQLKTMTPEAFEQALDAALSEVLL